MNHQSGRFGRLACAALMVLVVAGCSGASPAGPSGTAPGGQPADGQASAAGQAAAGPEQVVAVTFAGGAVQSGVSRTPVQLGRRVRLVVNSDVADEIHVHGYDLKADVPAHGVGTVEFVADQSGVFEVELESRAAQLAQLEVR